MQVNETLKNKRIVVTGASGFLGKVWIGLLLEQCPDVGQLYLLVRGKKGVTAHDRFMEDIFTSPAFRTVRARYGKDLLALVAEKITVVDGDVSRPLCGLNDADLKRVADADAVLHFAGVTDFEPDPTIAFAANAVGVSHVADLTAKTRGRKLVHTSTCFVAGNVSGRVPESIEHGVAPTGAAFDVNAELDAVDKLCKTVETKTARIERVRERGQNLGWPNIYTFTKALGEHVLAGRTDIQWTIGRPAIVESSETYPFKGWNEGLNTSGPLVWLLSSFFRRFPASSDNHFDVIPVDAVARAMTAQLAAHLEGTARPVYHLGTSDWNPLYFDRAIDLTALGARRRYDRDDAGALQKMFLKYWDAVPAATEYDAFPSLPFLRRLAQGGRNKLKDFEAEKYIPNRYYSKHGDRIEKRLKSISMDFRNADRVLSRVEDMLRLYKPFIHDNDYVFESGNTRALLDHVSGTPFDFDLSDLNWRTYWLDVHIPGLEKWSLPVIYGKKVENDPRPHWARTVRGAAKAPTAIPTSKDAHADRASA